MINKVFKLLLSSVILFATAGSIIYSQDPVPVERSNNKVVIEGSVYYVHVVKPGQTLYSISRAYNVTEKEIIIENPGVTSDLKIAQVLKIPANPSAAFSVNTMQTEQDESRHIIKQGETLYSISRKYGCTVEKILEMNPGLVIEDIQIGQAIIIPVESEVKNELSFDEEGFILHKVKRRETLYSISRYYDVSISEIKSVNPGIGWGGPRIGEILKIPKPNTTTDFFSVQDTIVADTLSVELADSLLIEEYRYDELLDRYYSGHEVFNIAYLIPFDFKAIEPLDSLLKDVKSAVRRERITEQYQLDKETPQALQFLEFFEGSLMAIDTLTDAGMELNVHFLDTRKSMYRTREILAQPAMADMDLIIGPFYTYNLELVSDFARENKIPVVTPFHNSDSLLKINPYLFQSSPSYKTEYINNAKYIARSYNDNLILVHNGDSSQLERINFYKETLFKELEKYSALETVVFKEVVIRNGNMDDLLHSLKSDMKNMIILPAIDEAFASQVASTLYYRLTEYDIQVFGSPYWAGFDDIEIEYIHKLQLTMSHNHYYDFRDPHFLGMLKKFRDNYFKEPSSYTRKGDNFGILGYDLSIYFLSALEKFGPAFILNLTDYIPAGVLCNYEFERITPLGGYENTFMRFYNFNKDMNVYEVSLPELPATHQFLQPAEDDDNRFRWIDKSRDTTDIDDL